MIFGYFTLVVALIISAVAEFYSIVGLTAIFSAAFWPVVIMGAALGVGKVTAAVWLKLNWDRAKWTYKVYLVPAVFFLMFLTSMGIFGFLSKAHSDQTLVSGDVQSKIAIYDEKIKTAKENIEADRKQLRQMDEAVDQVMARSTSEEGATKSNAIRKAQARDRTALAKNIEANQKLIGVLNDEAAPIRAEIRKVEAEVGPIKYIAALIYGDNTDENLLEAAVRWVIILIVAVFDPLALVLILAAQQSLRWAKDDKAREEQEKITEEEFRKELENDPEVSAFFTKARATAQALDRGDPIPGAVIEENLQDEQGDVSAENDNVVSSDPAAPPAEAVHQPDTHPYLKQGFAYPPGWMFHPPMVAKPADTESTVDPEPIVAEVIETDKVSIEPEEVKIELPLDSVKEAVEPPPKAKIVVPEAFDPKLKKVTADTRLTADNDQSIPKEIKAHFGIAFPDGPEKGEVFLRVDYLPSRLYKFNGNVWIEVDKSLTDSYIYNHEYIKFLISEIEQGRIDPDDISAGEREQITEFLANNEPTRNPT
jgi:hypothetical protein